MSSPLELFCYLETCSLYVNLLRHTSLLHLDWPILHSWAAPPMNPAHFPVTLTFGLVLLNPLMQGGFCVLALQPQPKVPLQMNRPPTPSLKDYYHWDVLWPLTPVQPESTPTIPCPIGHCDSNSSAHLCLW